MKRMTKTRMMLIRKSIKHYKKTSCYFGTGILDLEDALDEIEAQAAEIEEAREKAWWWKTRYMSDVTSSAAWFDVESREAGKFPWDKVMYEKDDKDKDDTDS